MDERSQSAAESVGLILEAGAKHTFGKHTQIDREG